MDPDVDGSDRQEGLEARSDALPADDQAVILLLAPGKGALGWETGHHFFDRSPTVFLGLPDTFWELRPNTTVP